VDALEELQKQCKQIKSALGNNDIKGEVSHRLSLTLNGIGDTAGWLQQLQQDASAMDC